jgi:hypothetical protein
VLLGYNFTWRRHEFGAELATPCAEFEGPVLPCTFLNGRNVFPRLIVARAVAMMHRIEDAELCPATQLAAGGDGLRYQDYGRRYR